MKKDPLGFMSYVRFDDKHENGRLSQFCERLTGEVRVQTGERFHVFQDRNDIDWGQQWQQRIDESLDAVTFLIPIITPSFFKSAACRAELDRFLDREKRLGRGDLVLPVYYINCPILDDETKREADPLARGIHARQYIDWREFRFEPFTSAQIGKMLAKMATQIVEALERDYPERKPSPLPVATPGEGGQADSPASSEHMETSTQTAEIPHGPTPRTEPPTLVVDALHRGDHATLTAALATAEPGDRILVRSGLYREDVVIDKPVEIIGDGELGEVVIEASEKDAVLFKTSMGRIANLTLRQTGDGKWYCVDIAQGRLDLEGCDISSQSLACVAIHGGADPRLRRNRIHDGKQAGVFVYENGQGTLEDNDIFANALAGVSIKEGGNPTLRRNRIHDGKAGGVYVYENGQGTLEDNDIFANAIAGVEIKGGNPTLRRNRIHDGKQSGVYVHSSGQGTLEDNDIFANEYSGVSIKEGGNPTLRRNRIHDGKGSGVHVYENGQGTLEDNDIFANALAGVEIKEGSNPTLRRNRIHDGKAGGVYVHENGQGTLEDNDIFANAYSGVEIKDGGNPTLRRNRVYDGKQSGVYVHSGGEGTLEDNDLRGNAKGAWNISADCQGNVKRTRNQE